MALELLETLESAGLAAGFWGFLLSSRYRERCRARWRSATGSGRAAMVLNGALGMVIGLGLPALLVYLLLS